MKRVIQQLNNVQKKYQDLLKLDKRIKLKEKQLLRNLTIYCILIGFASAFLGEWLCRILL